MKPKAQALSKSKDVGKRRLHRLVRPIPDDHPEAICDDCGGANVVWFAPNLLWNQIVRRPDQGDPMLCPRCFILRAEAMGYSKVWKVAPEMA